MQFNFANVCSATHAMSLASMSRITLRHACGRAAIQRRATVPSAFRRPAPAWRRAPLRCMASYGGPNRKDEKSWSEIGSEAMQVAKDLATKVTEGVKDVVGALVPHKPAPKPEPRRDWNHQDDGLRFPRDAFGGGLMGRMVGGMLGGAINKLGRQMQEVQQQTADVRARAASAIENNAEVRRRMGGTVQVGQPISQSSMSQWINGRSSKQVTLVLPVVGTSGRMAQAEVTYSEGDDRRGSDEGMRVAVQLPDGGRVRVDGSAVEGSVAGKTIDVDWREIR